MKRVLLAALVPAAFAAVMAMPASASEGSLGKMTVFKTPWCGCCAKWTDKMKELGYEVVIEDMQDLSGIKKQAGVPKDMEGCHTAVVENGRKYVLEGHVPPQAITKALTEQPDVRGLAVPGMPGGAIGMSNDPNARYMVYAINMSSDEPVAAYFEVKPD